MSAPRVEVPGVRILVTPDCVHADEARGRVAAVLGRLAPGSEPEVIEVASLDDARRLGFPGSPTVRVDGDDVEGEEAPSAAAVACRTYGEGRGVPPDWMVEAAVLRSLAPRHVLFLCVANSARSQMAEGIARSVAPEDVRISSAGSEPASVRAEAVEVLAERGIDIGDQRSTAVGDVDGPVDAVITLCAEEVCPAWLGDTLRVHWPFPDPAAAGGEREERLEAYRSVRDGLRRRLEALFPG